MSDEFVDGSMGQHGTLVTPAEKANGRTNVRPFGASTKLDSLLRFLLFLWLHAARELRCAADISKSPFFDSLRQAI
jgi:hypothetical protein